jgi:hypothetical protein
MTTQQTAFCPNQFDQMIVDQGYIALSSNDLAFFRLELRALEVTESSVLLKVRFSFQMSNWDLIPWTGGTGEFYNVLGNCRFPLDMIPSDLVSVFERNISATEDAVAAGISYDKQPKVWMTKSSEPCVLAFRFRPVVKEDGTHLGVITSIELPLGSLVFSGWNTGSEAEVEEMVGSATQFVSFAAASAVASQAAPNPGNAADALVRS